MPAKSRLQPELAAPQFVQKRSRDEKACGNGQDCLRHDTAPEPP
jgi:hypothetical protein